VYKLTYKGQFVEGFDEDQVIGNLAQLLNLKPKVVRLAFVSDRPSVIKMLDSASEVEQWCAAFQEAGVYLDVSSLDSPDAETIADQIDIELELHSLDQDEDEEELDERNYLIRKVLIPEPESRKNGSHNPPVTAEPIEAKPEPVIKPIEIAVSELSVAKIDALTKQLLEEESKAAPKTPIIPESPVPEIPAEAKPQIKTPEKTKVVKPKSEKVKTDKVEVAKTKAEKVNAPKVDNKAKEENLESEKSQVKKIEIKKIEPEQVQSKVEVDKVDGPKAEILDSKPAKKTANKKSPNKKPEDKTVLKKQSIQPAKQSQETSQDPQEKPVVTHKDPQQAVIKPAPTRQGNLHLVADSGKVNEEKLLSLELEHAEDTLDDVNFHKSYFVWGMLVILLAIIATAGAIFWLKRSSWTPVNISPQEIKITEAIASGNLFGLVHVDIKRLQSLAPTATHALNQFPAPEANFWKNLSSAKIDLNEQVDDAWLAVYDQNKALWVLHGNFPTEIWKEFFKKNYVIDGDNPDGIIFSSMDENSCEKTVLSASVSKTQIVIGVPELVATFNGRLQASAAPEKNLEAWAKSYNNQMASAVLFHPAQLTERSAASALWQLFIPAEPIQGVYLGLETKMFPPGVEFSAAILSEDQPFLEDTTKKLTAAATLAKTTIVTDWPETQALYEHLKISQEPNQVIAKLNMDEKAPQQIQLLLESLISYAFALETSTPVEGGGQLDDSPQSFANLPSADLPAFAKHVNDDFVVQTSSGPFGIGVRNVEQTEQGVEINMEVKAFNLPNFSKENDSVFLQIKDIVDHQDQSLLADTNVCAGGLKQSTPINSQHQITTVENDQHITFTELQGTKKIILPAGIGLANVGAVKGIISHQLPIEIERIKVNGPLAGKTLDVQGIKFRFFAADANRLYFQMSGNTATLLQVNALNEEGKALASTSTLRGNGLFDRNTISIDYQEKIASAEIVVATKLEQKNYEFSIAQLFPPAKPFVQEKSKPVYLTAANLPALEKDTPPNDVAYPIQTPKQIITAGPALIALNDLAITGQQFSLVADIYTRNSHPLTGQLNAVRLVITEVEDSSGNLHSANQQASVALEHMGGNWANGKFEADPNRPWLRGVLEMRDRSVEQSDAIAFWGKLVFVAMEDPVPIKVPFQFGMQWNSNEGVLKLRRWEEGRLIFEVEGNFPELMAVKALDEKGQLVSQPAELHTNFGKNTIELEVKQIPDAIEFNIARTQSVKEFPLEIRVQ
jgi:hypothetical protein